MEGNLWASAPYGRSCASCAKSKCIDGGRCLRLGKECQPASRVRKSISGRTSVAAKTAQLERRLDGLVTLLRATEPTSTSNAILSDPEPSSLPSHGESLPAPTDGTAADEEILSEFRLEQLPFLPIVHIPATATATQMRQESPFLWRCISTLNQKNTSQQTTLHTEIKEVIAKALLVDCDRSLDLLQAILVFLGWYGVSQAMCLTMHFAIGLLTASRISFQCQPRKGTLGPYMQMAISLVFDLGLNKPTSQNPNNMAPSQCFKAGHNYIKSWLSRVRTMNERRAVLGCFLVSSSISHFLGRAESLRWTPHMKECLDILADSKETPNDALLVYMTRACLIADNIMRGLGHDCDILADDNALSRAPVRFYIKAFQSQFIDLRDQMPPDLCQNKALQLHLYYAEATLYETCLSKPTGVDGDIDFTRLDDLYACLYALKKWFQLIFDFPIKAWLCLPSTIILPVAHCLVTLFRLTTFEYPGWDGATVRQSLDVLSVTQQVADKFTEAAEQVGHQNQDTLGASFCRGAKITLTLRARWASRLLDMQPASLDSVDSVKSPPPPPPPAEFDQQFFDAWLSLPDMALLTDSLMMGG
ncbi:hypothetical protein ARAM_001655 [Aspergillus rambellii]|uniref:Zn(2)-C6 fungal-type domain-containing protein n=1 Tax=Aspergillus rambellii TaxID=308745 RepID=A0A0F8WPT1_9EURO|nr:hypothetical protein ARAM_001655 [Aspergillus rambellii]